jgi:hypothetical protein
VTPLQFTTLDDFAPTTSVPVLAKTAPTGMGNAELSRLWALGASQPLEADTGEQVIHPSHKTYLDRVRNEADPDNGIEEAYRMCNNAVFEWKTLRTVLEQNAMALNFPAMFKIKADLVTLVTGPDSNNAVVEGVDGGGEFAEIWKRGVLS